MDTNRLEKNQKKQKNPLRVDSRDDADDILFDNKVKSKHPKKTSRQIVAFWTIGAISFAGGIACVIAGILGFNNTASDTVFPKISSTSDVGERYYSNLTGEPLANSADQTAPTFCIQTPNGADGARPQSGLTKAGVVFEAIAEAGITRFAAIYQNPSQAVIGPIRSLRLYYLEWDTPFDCTIVHAGGADDALQAVASGGYRDLSEDYAYMYRGTSGARLWNNLFTTSNYLKKFNEDNGYNSSNVKGFTRMTPEESGKSRVNTGVKEQLNIVKATTENTSETVAAIPSIDLNLGGWDNFNIHYEYDSDTNTYDRSYQSGAEHEVYECADEDLGEKNPEDVCSLTQMSPSVVIAMVVQESRASDNYHEDITTLGSGNVYIFQNGTAITGTWTKTSVDEQIKFFDENGKEIALAPGQTFVTAVPSYGDVEF